MSFITLNRNKLQHNYTFLDQLFNKNNMDWAIVAKMLCGHEGYLAEVLKISDRDICDSRLSNLKAIKKISPEAQTIYIKPPAQRLVKSIVEYADVSFNTEIQTLYALSAEAVKQDKVHRVVLMVEMGELREGILPDQLADFYEEVLHLPNLLIVGLGTNLNCLNGILPDEEKLQNLKKCREMLEKRFGKKIPYISGGSSVTLPLLLNNEIPDGINHFRIGETLFFGTDVYADAYIEGMYQDVFTLTAEIIELNEKPKVPTGIAGTNLTGEQPEFDLADEGKTSVRAIVDIGLLDIDAKNISPLRSDISIIGASSDMLVLDLGDNETAFKVGDTLEFGMNYMAVLRAMNSDYVDKVVVDTVAEPLENKESILS